MAIHTEKGVVRPFRLVLSFSDGNLRCWCEPGRRERVVQAAHVHPVPGQGRQPGLRTRTMEGLSGPVWVWPWVFRLLTVNIALFIAERTGRGGRGGECVQILTERPCVLICVFTYAFFRGNDPAKSTTHDATQHSHRHGKTQGKGSPSTEDQAPGQ